MIQKVEEESPFNIDGISSLGDSPFDMLTNNVQFLCRSTEKEELVGIRHIWTIHIDSNPNCQSCLVTIGMLLRF